MRRTHWILFALLPAFVLAGCGDDDDGNGGGETAMVTISGTAGVGVDETLQLTATTQNGTDASYTWNSSDTNVATVDADGLVTGVAAGDATITATGADTGASDTHAIVVFEPSADVGPVADIVAAWEGSGHADSLAEAFRHWDEDDPAEVSTSCARCHTSQGYTDYLQDGVVDAAVPASEAQGINCSACHSNAASSIESVEFPSGVILTDLGGSARCQTCHQGRESTDTLDARLIDEATGEPIGDDALVPNGRFVNVHYFAAGATLNGTLVRGGYQYPDQVYDARFQHAEGLNECTSCHNAHTLEIKLDACAGCHTGVSTIEDVYDIRMAASGSFDYDGDGDMTEGVYYEVEGLRERLLPAIQAYATATEGVGDICYNESAYPYWFSPGDDGTCLTDDDQGFGNWTPRLLKATYNYQYSGKDPGGFAHNAKYVIELIYDSLADMGEDVTNLQRGDFGHFDGSAEPFRHWDEYANEDGTGEFIGEVEAGCAKCHGGVEGFTNYLAAFAEDPTVDEETLSPIHATQVNGLDCTVCHASASTFELRDVASFRFPSGVVIEDYDVGGDYVGANICATCHSGREAQATIDAYLAEVEADPDATLGFQNVHYKPAAGSLFGSEANVGYQYDNGATYAGRWTHPAGAEGNECTYCHRPAPTDHTFIPRADESCAGCHQGSTDILTFQNTSSDVDANGTVEHGSVELASLREALLVEIQAVTDICYNGDRYPYWFTSGDDLTCGTADDGRSVAWTEPLVRAAHNYQFATKDPGAWAHGFVYHAQLLNDSIADLRGVGPTETGFNRP